MIDYPRLQLAARLVPISELAIGYLNVNRTLLEPNILGTNADPYTLDTASVMTALAAIGAPSTVVVAFELFLDVLAYRYTVLETVGLPVGVDPAVLDALVTAKVAVATATKLDKSVYDKNNDGKVDIENQNDASFLFSVPALQWVQPHTYGRIPDVTLLNVLGEQIQADVRATTTSVIVDFGAPTAGQLILR
jgi:hypothetical protein